MHWQDRGCTIAWEHIKNGIISSMRRSEKRWQRPRISTTKEELIIKKALIEFDQVEKKTFCWNLFRFIFKRKKKLFFFTRRWTFLEHYCVAFFPSKFHERYFLGLLVVYKCIKSDTAQFMEFISLCFWCGFKF